MPEKVIKKLKRVTYRLYPTKAQQAALFKRLNLHRLLYNSILESRKDAYRKTGKYLFFANICREITQLRKSDPEFASLNAQSLQYTAKRNSRAFENFFRRLKSGDTPGFPRFKSRDRFKSFQYSASGWLLIPGAAKGKRKMRHGKLRLEAEGFIKMRGAAKENGIPRTCDILYDSGRWYASIVIDVFGNIQRKAGLEAGAFDWGTETFATIALDDGTYDSIPNPRNGMKAKKKLAQAQKELSRKKRRSKNRDKAKKKVRKIYRDISNLRNNFLHQTSNEMIKRFGLLATEELGVQKMVEKNSSEGKNGLSREILDVAPSRFLDMLRYKAEEADSEFVKIKTMKWKPSQRCSRCGRVAQKELSCRMHRCSCGLELTRDENAARVCLNIALIVPVERGVQMAWNGPVLEAGLVSRRIKNLHLRRKLG